ncbi:MAG: permease-like cell division protein FtsX [Lachnospiraceae bacterium]|nr:permease-like cell division protein FtsX [Lachnospiraceae bacterium]
MRINTFFYCVGQGFKNLFRNKWFALASIATITACLFMVGVLYSIVLNFRHVVQSVEQNVSVTVFFIDGTTEDQILQRKVEIEERPEVADVTYLSADEAWESFKVDYLGEYSEGFTENPLEGMSNLEINLADVSLQDELVSFLRALPEVREVNYSSVTAETLTGANSVIAYASIGIVLLLFAVSVFLISNTIAMGIELRKEEISIMKYVGGTDFFVRSPFVIEGLVIGLVGSVIPLVILYFFYTKVNSYVTSRFPALTNILNLLTIQDIFRTLVPFCIIIGVAIGFFGSWFTVRKHLRV